MRVVSVPTRLLDDTFRILRECGSGKRECQVLWLSAWESVDDVARVEHPRHSGHKGGFQVDDEYITRLWIELGEVRSGIRVQVHTHPGTAFHSPTDDRWPFVHLPGFLSLVIPNFARESVGFEGAYLALIDDYGRWREVNPCQVLNVT